MSPVIDREICGYCGACISVCPSNAIELVDTYVRFKTQDLRRETSDVRQGSLKSQVSSLRSDVSGLESSPCIGCLACVRVCPLGAMKPDAGHREGEAPAEPHLTLSAVSTFDTADFHNRESKIENRLPRTRRPENRRSVDVLVIGGGPAGSTAAKMAAEQNVAVMMIEKRQEIGSPVRCAEGVGREALAQFIELDPKWISAEINGGRIYAPDGNFVTIDSEGSGLILERKIFDRELSAQAAQSGAEVWVKARAIDLVRRNGSVAGAVVRRPDGDYTVHAKVVIAADGVESQVGKWAGIDTTCKTHEVDTCAQYLMTGLPYLDSNYCNFYLGHQIAPRGYAWIFPKGNGSANVGIGIGGNIGGTGIPGPRVRGDDGQKAIDYLNRFVEKQLLKENYGEEGTRRRGGEYSLPRSHALTLSHPCPHGSPSILSMVVGCVPVAGTLPDIVRDGFMIVGDAAHQNDPVSGGGIINSMIAGQIAGEVASRAVWNGDVSRAALVEYEKRWYNQVGRTFRHLRRLREGILKFSDETLNSIARVLSEASAGKGQKAKRLTLVDIFWTALKNDPKLLLELRHLTAMGWAQ